MKKRLIALLSVLCLMASLLCACGKNDDIGNISSDTTVTEAPSSEERGEGPILPEATATPGPSPTDLPTATTAPTPTPEPTATTAPVPTSTPTPFPEEPDDTGIWENNADISWIDPSKPMIAFTFDDGPVGTADTATSIRIQNALAASGQHATFFYWGNSLNKGTEAEIKRAYDMGFEIGNHTRSHQDLSKLTADKIYAEVMDQAEKLSAITGLEHFLVRPPYLSTNTTVKLTVREPMINCSIDTKDWAGATAEAIINTINTQKKDGAIVLMHETYAATATAMETLIPQLVAEGWQIVSVSELFKAKGQNLLDGMVYSNAR